MKIFLIIFLLTISFLSLMIVIKKMRKFEFEREQFIDYLKDENDLNGLAMMGQLDLFGNVIDGYYVRSSTNPIMRSLKLKIKKGVANEEYISFYRQCKKHERGTLPWAIIFLCSIGGIIHTVKFLF